MNDIIEVSNSVTDVFAFELRVGDRVEGMWEEGMLGTVIEVTPARGEIMRDLADGSVRVQDPPTVRVMLDNGTEIVLETQFLRSPVWRWHCVDIIRKKETK